MVYVFNAVIGHSQRSAQSLRAEHAGSPSSGLCSEAADPLKAGEGLSRFTEDELQEEDMN